eukprot:TRINITY_DN38588_c1_g1_i2.p1 TRINITY_DN38588_c1_g1~~TRINITY_DN38588_c1_g1_i2.p1  ORF type:complete len:705 (+),score=176.98 TRINITY_DN38588_c1_g1_i2:234-2348(+)
MKLDLGEENLEKLNKELEEAFEEQGSFDKKNTRFASSRRVQLVLTGLAKRELNLRDADVKMFGSFLNGFQTGGSDLDLVLIPSPGGETAALVMDREKVAGLLEKMSKLLPAYGFTNITNILQANVPIVKATDITSKMEVDFCINNQLGIRNSLLLQTYSKVDDRVAQLGKLVKDWAKRNQIVGTADGCLNSYAYMLLVLYFLMEVGVLPNLQMLGTEPMPVMDNKWGGLDSWDTKFLEDISSLEKSDNKSTLGELLIGFFDYYTNVFDWSENAVCIRLFEPCLSTPKSALKPPYNDEQWYVEDPFDLRHNLAGRCSKTGRDRMRDSMEKTLNALVAGDGWQKACGGDELKSCFLKCRVNSTVAPERMLEHFEDYGLVKMYLPHEGSSRNPFWCFLEFGSVEDRRLAHTRNETKVLHSDCQLCLHYTSKYSLQESLQQGQYILYEMESFKTQRKALKERAAMQRELSDFNDHGAFLNFMQIPHPKAPKSNKPYPAYEDGVAGQFPPGMEAAAKAKYAESMQQLGSLGLPRIVAPPGYDFKAGSMMSLNGKMPSGGYPPHLGAPQQQYSSSQSGMPTPKQILQKAAPPHAAARLAPTKAAAAQNGMNSNPVENLDTSWWEGSTQHIQQREKGGNGWLSLDLEIPEDGPLVLDDETAVVLQELEAWAQSLPAMKDVQAYKIVDLDVKVQKDFLPPDDEYIEIARLAV